MWGLRLHRGLATRATRLSPPLVCARASPRLLSSSASSPPEHTSATPDATPTAREIAAASAREHGFSPRPSYSRAARRERLLAALELAKAGEEFELPKAQPVEIPGPCGAVMNLLRERGPLTTEAMWAALEERYPGVVKSRQHLEDQVLGEHLRNKLIKVSPLCHALIVKIEGSLSKDHWSFRKAKQPRMKSARERKSVIRPRRSSKAVSDVGVIAEYFEKSTKADETSAPDTPKPAAE
ncbi:MAG: hypothetical protein SGPRY_004450 [Prymnesium sp.]